MKKVDFSEFITACDLKVIELMILALAQGHYVPPTEGGGGHIVFGADPVCVGVRVAWFPRVIF